MKQKFISLGLALAMLLGIAGCNITTPATVGSIGGVEIPAGIYLLAQLNAYNTAASLVDFATGESADDINVVLKAEVTGTINDEEVTTDGADYISRLTMSSLEYYAAVETLFDSLGATLEDAATSEAADSASSMWESQGDLYTANGISQDSLEAYLLVDQKAQACLDALYGPDGQQPVTEDEYRDFIENDCRFIESVSFPLIDYSTYNMVSTGDTAYTEIQNLAAQCAVDLNESLPVTNAITELSILQSAAAYYVPQAMEALGSTLESSQASYYASAQLYLPSELEGYSDGNGGNTLTDALDADPENFVTVNMGTALVVARAVDPLSVYDVDTFVSSYDLLTEMKQQDLLDQLYSDGATMEHALDESAMNTYKVQNIKHSV